MSEGGKGPYRELNRSEVVAKHLAPHLVSAVEKIPVRFIPTAFARHMVVSRASKYALVYSTYIRSNEPLMQELTARGEPPPDVLFVQSIAVLAARDSYWLGAGARAVLKSAKVPKAKRADKIAASVGLLLHSYGPEAPVRRRRSVSVKDNWGRRRLSSDKMELNEDGRVQYREAPKAFLRSLQEAYPDSGCPAHNIRKRGEPSPVVLYWQAYTKKVFTPWGRKR